jgi:hypothetical protein
LRLRSEDPVHTLTMWLRTLVAVPRQRFAMRIWPQLSLRISSRCGVLQGDRCIRKTGCLETASVGAELARSHIVLGLRAGYAVFIEEVLAPERRTLDRKIAGGVFLGQWRPLVRPRRSK